MNSVFFYYFRKKNYFNWLLSNLNFLCIYICILLLVTMLSIYLFRDAFVKKRAYEMWSSINLSPKIEKSLFFSDEKHSYRGSVDVCINLMSPLRSVWRVIYIRTIVRLGHLPYSLVTTVNDHCHFWNSVFAPFDIISFVTDMRNI